MATQPESLDNSRVGTGSMSQGFSARAPEIEYRWVITFRRNISEQHPFQINLLSVFENDEIPAQWINSKMTVDNRHEKFLFQSMSDDYYSVFCRVERGN